MVNFVHRRVFGGIPVWVRGWFVLSGENDNEINISEMLKERRCMIQWSFQRADNWLHDRLIKWKYFAEISTHYLVVIKMKVKYDHVDMTGPSRQGLSVVSTIDYLMGAILEVCMVFSVTIISSLTRYTTSSGELFFGYVWWCSCLQSYHYVYFQLFFGYVCRLEICRDRRDRRSCEIFASCVNFSRKQCSFLHISQVYTHLNVNFLHNC